MHIKLEKRIILREKCISTYSKHSFNYNYFSAGIGRTGTYIALDVLYREGERTGEVNVPMYVKTMRKDRINMVQTEVRCPFLIA